MTGTVEIPIWMVLALAALAAIALVDRIFAPSVRWFFRRRLNNAIDELNQRLDLRIQPFKLTRRQTLIDQLLYDRKVIEAVEAEAKASGVPRAVLMRKAERYAREIVPSFSVATYFGFGIRAARWLSNLLYRVTLGFADDAALRAIDPHASVVFVMNHRSNMDYVLVTYMASSRASLSYAVGEWARIWILENLIRSMGAYFIRRNSGDALYRRVLGRYVHMATHQGVTQAIFPEGGLSRDGKLRDPKLGLLGYVVSEFDAADDRDIVFVPVGLNYDRVLEDRILTAHREREVSGRDFRVRMSAVLGFLGNLFWRRLTGRLYRFGYACVSFGEPLSLAQWQRERQIQFRELPQEARFVAVEKLASTLMQRIGAVVPALPVAMLSRLLLEAGDEWVAEPAMRQRALDLTQKLESRGAHVHLPRADRDYAFTTGLRMLALRNLVQQGEDGQLRANPAEKTLLAYYANSIAHLLH